jgi:hypothetical protein
MAGVTVGSVGSSYTVRGPGSCDWCLRNGTVVIGKDHNARYGVEWSRSGPAFTSKRASERDCQKQA